MNSKFLLIILPFNLVTKSATVVLVLLNSVLVEAKVVFVVSKSFEVAEPFYFILILPIKFVLIILPFNLVVKSATTAFVLLNSVLVEAKFVFVVFKSFEVAEPFHSIKNESISHYFNKLICTSQIFLKFFFSDF